jgi:hypothetical protein
VTTAATTDSRPPSNTTSTTSAATTGWRLQIIGGIPAQNAHDLVAWLTQQGYDATEQKKGGVWIVYVATNFESNESSDAKAFQEKFRAMEYQGKKQFDSCLFVK